MREKELPGRAAKSVMVKLLKIAGAGAALYAAIAGALFVVMLQTPDVFARTMKHVPWPAMAIFPFRPLLNMARGGHLEAGDLAPDFSLESPDHKTRFQLSSLRGQKPIVLVFGSYT
jgi:hypothetical protein